MIFGFPTLLQEVGLYITLALSLIALLGFAEKRLKLLSTWFRKNITEDVNTSISTLSVDFLEYSKYVKYHLGPNGNTPPIHERLQNLENNFSVHSLRQRKFMDALNKPLAEVDINASLVMVNRAWLDFFDVKEWEIMGDSWKRYIKIEDFDIFKERLAYSSRTMETVGPFEITSIDDRKFETIINPMVIDQVFKSIIEIDF